MSRKAASCMTAAEALARLGEERLLDEVAIGWEEAMAALPEGLPDFLEPEVIVRSRALAGLEEDLDAPLLETAGRVASDEALRRLAWYYCRRIYEGSPAGLKTTPGLEAVLGEGGGLFSLLLGLAFVPRLVAYHRVLGIPEGITAETAGQIACYCDNYRRAHEGRAGVFMKQLTWLRSYFHGSIYLRLGRFEYWLSPFRGGVLVYRHRGSGQVLALAEAGQRFDADGYLRHEAADASGETGGWTSALSLTATQARGNPVSPDGHARPEEVVLDLEEWHPVLRRGDWVLDIHIPAGGAMSPESCRDSLQRAAAFFKERFPDHRASAFTCASWIFSPQLQELLPPEANLVRLQRELYLYPQPGRSNNIWFIFLQDSFNAATAPRQTSLQRVLADYLADGNLWCHGGMFLLLDDLPRFGSRPYGPGVLAPA